MREERQPPPPRRRRHDHHLPPPPVPNFLLRHHRQRIKNTIRRSEHICRKHPPHLVGRSLPHRPHHPVPRIANQRINPPEPPYRRLDQLPTLLRHRNVTPHAKVPAAQLPIHLL